VFSLGPVFSAFGSSVSDICHVYERAMPDPALTDANVSLIRQMVQEMKNEGTQDLLGEGIKPEHLSYALEFEIAGKNRHSAPVACAESTLGSSRDLQAALQAAPGAPKGAISIDLVRLRVKKEMSKPWLTEQPAQTSDSSHARVGKRQVFWGSQTGEAHIYRWESLRPGNRVDGCAVLEGLNTTYFVAQGWSLVVDGFGNAKLSRA
jgi:N-methylhydantoinase A/oxoprolinase/acetone carboxylase beta subunit